MQTLDEQRREFSRRRFLATPLAGAIAWASVGLAGLLLRPEQAAIVMFVATGLITYLGIFISRFTGENFLDRTKPKNAFDSLFFHTVIQALLVYAIAIPFFVVDFRSLPLTVGILTGLMWVPFSWIIEHWIGLFHSAARTLAIVAAWYMFPAERFVVIPFVIVAIYILTIFTLEKRWRAFPRQT